MTAEKANLTYRLVPLQSLGEVGVLERPDVEHLLVHGRAYERDISGIDMGFNSMLAIASAVYFIDAPDKSLAGFFLGSNVAYQENFPGEREMYPFVAYLDPKYRASAGNYKDVLEDSLRGFIDAVEVQGYDRLDVFPPLGSGLRETLVTPIGLQKVLRKLHFMLLERTKEGTLYVGDVMKYHAGYLFRGEEYKRRVFEHASQRVSVNEEL